MGLSRLAQEAVDNGLMPHDLAQGISHVKGVKSEGVRTGNWLSLAQAESLLTLPDPNTLRGKRDRALLAVLIGCGLRREEAANLKLEHIQMRDARWVIVDIQGKGGRTRSVPMPAWCKQAIDEWCGGSVAFEGFGLGLEPTPVFRPVNKGDHLTPESSMTAQSIFAVVQKYARSAGLGSISPHDLRRTFAKLAHKGHAALEQIQLSLGHASIKTTERYLGIEQDLTDAPCDHLGIAIKA